MAMTTGQHIHVIRNEFDELIRNSYNEYEKGLLWKARRAFNIHNGHESLRILERLSDDCTAQYRGIESVASEIRLAYQR